jgi:hypothetical protein
MKLRKVSTTKVQEVLPIKKGTVIKTLNGGEEVFTEKKPVGRPAKVKPNKFNGHTVLKMKGKILAKDLKVGDTVVFSLDKCQVLRIEKASRKLQQEVNIPGLIVVSLHNHPRLGGATMPCRPEDYWYADFEVVGND